MTANSLLFGIEFEKFKKEYEDFKSIPFPDKPECDDGRLVDIYSELVETDGFVAGIASTFIKTKKIDINIVKIDEELNDRIACFESSDYQIKKDLLKYLDYKKNIDSLIISLIKLNKIS